MKPLKPLKAMIKTDLWYNKGLFHEHVGHKIEALKCYDKMIEINPNHVKAWIKKGLIHKRWDDAIKCYDKAIEINSNYENNVDVSSDNTLYLWRRFRYE